MQSFYVYMCMYYKYRSATYDIVFSFSLCEYFGFKYVMYSVYNERQISWASTIY